jgi:hypothetical protein
VKVRPQERIERRSKVFEEVHMRTRWIGLGVAAVALAFPSAALAGGLVQASPLPGNVPTSGPVLEEGRAVWGETSGNTLTLRSLDEHGRTRTLLTTSDTPGVAPGQPANVSVPSLAAGEGRIALIREISAGVIARCPPLSTPCYPAPIPPPKPVSYSLLAGRPRAVRTLRTVSGSCYGGVAPFEAGVTSLGVVAAEQPAGCHRDEAGPRLVLYPFSKHGRRTLIAGPPGATISSLSAAGTWIAWIQDSEDGRRLQLYDLRARRIVLRRPEPEMAFDVVLDSSGDFAVSLGGTSYPCYGGTPDFAIRVGSANGGRMHTLVNSAVTPAAGITRGRIAYMASNAQCPASIVAAISTPSGQQLLFPMLHGPGQLAFDGKALAVASEKQISLLTPR